MMIINPYRFAAATTLTNNCLYSRDLTNGVWTTPNVTETYDQTGIDGDANTATLLAPTSSGLRRAEQANVAVNANEVNCLSMFFRKGYSDDMNLQIRYSNSTSKRVGGVFNSVTGIASLDYDNCGDGVYSVVDYDASWWRVMISGTDQWTSSVVSIFMYITTSSQQNTIVGNVGLYPGATVAEVTAHAPIYTTSSPVTE